MFLILSTLP